MASVLIATGGTIAWSSEQNRMLGAAELASCAGVEVARTIDVDAVPSWDLSIESMTAIANEVCRAVDTGAEVVVVTHGTDTIEETAWVTELFLGPERRRTAAVVFTGAMRLAGATPADGPTNVRHAFLHGRATIGAGNGVQVCFAGRVHAARWVRKVRAGGLDPFSSAGRPPAAGPPPSSVRSLDPGVAVVKVGGILRPHLPEMASGLVLEGTGRSHVPSCYHSALRAIAETGTPVVLATRAHDTPRPARSGPWLYACDLTAEKAGLALMAAVASSDGPDGVAAWWEELMTAAVFVTGEIT